MSFFVETSTLASVLCVDIDILSVGYRFALDIELRKLFWQGVYSLWCVGLVKGSVGLVSVYTSACASLLRRCFHDLRGWGLLCCNALYFLTRGMSQFACLPHLLSPSHTEHYSRCDCRAMAMLRRYDRCKTIGFEPRSRSTQTIGSPSYLKQWWEFP